MKGKFRSIWIIVVFSLFTCCESKQEDDFLLLKETDSGFGYVNKKGKPVIPFGKYQLCLTDTFRTFAFVVKSGSKVYAINRNEKILFEAYIFDNGPDYLQDGLFRIRENDKIGFANSKGEIVIEPKFECAFPFENNKAKVSDDCQVLKMPGEEHEYSESKNWYYINKKGERVKGKL